MPGNPIGVLLRQVDSCVGAVGQHLNQMSDIEAAIAVLQDLLDLRVRAQEIQDKHKALFEQIAAAPLAAAQTFEEKIETEKIEEGPVVEVPPASTAVFAKTPSAKKAPAKKTSSRQVATQPRRRGRPSEETEHTPLQMYRPFILRAMLQLKGAARYAEIQKTALQLMKEAGVARPQDEEPVGPSGVIRYIAQSGAAKKQLLKDNLIQGSGPEGFTLTHQGEEELKKLSS